MCIVVSCRRRLLLQQRAGRSNNRTGGGIRRERGEKGEASVQSRDASELCQKKIGPTPLATPVTLSSKQTNKPLS